MELYHTGIVRLPVAVVSEYRTTPGVDAEELSHAVHFWRTFGTGINSVHSGRSLVSVSLKVKFLGVA